MLYIFPTLIQIIFPSQLLFLILFNYYLKKGYQDKIFLFFLLPALIFDFTENNFFGLSFLLLIIDFYGWVAINRIFTFSHRLKFFLLTILMIISYWGIKFFIILKYPLNFFLIITLKDLIWSLILTYG